MVLLPSACTMFWISGSSDSSLARDTQTLVPTSGIVCMCAASFTHTGGASGPSQEKRTCTPLAFKRVCTPWLSTSGWRPRLKSSGT